MYAHAKIQISLCIRTVWSESSLGARWIVKVAKFLHAATKTDQTARMRRLILVFAGRTRQKMRFLTLRSHYVLTFDKEYRKIYRCHTVFLFTQLLGHIIN